MIQTSLQSQLSLDDQSVLLFDALAGSSLLLKNNTPTFTILAAAPQYVKETGLNKKDLVGKGFFDAFETNPVQPDHSREKELRFSLTQVLEKKERHLLPPLTFHLKNEDGTFEERFWSVDNNPVLDKNGNVLYLVHTIVTAGDKGDERKTQQRLHESEQAQMATEVQQASLRNMVLSAPIGICVLEAPGLVATIANHHFVKLAAKPINEIIGQFYWDVFALVRPHHEAALRKVISEGVTFRADEVEVPFKQNGKTENLYVSFIYEPLRNKSAEVTKVAVWVIDNTKQVLQRRKVEESENNLRNVILQAPVAMSILKSPKFIVEIANEHMYQLWGRGKDELLGRPLFDALPEVRDQGYEELLNRVFTTGERFTAFSSPVTLLRNGVLELAYINFLYEAFREPNGTISGVMVVANDVTEQVEATMKVEKSHEELQFAIDAMPQMVWITKPDGYHDLYNSQWYKYTGLPPERSKGGGWSDVLHPDDRERAWKVWQNSLDTGEPYEIEYRMKRHDGAYHWFLGRALPLRNEEGTITKWFGTCTDIDDQRRAAELMEFHIDQRTEELQKSNRELARSNQNLEEFAYAASHDLKEPMRKIQLFSDRLASRLTDRLDEEEKSYLSRILRATDRMNTLIDDLLNYSQLGTGVQLEESIDLNKKVNLVLDDLEVEIFDNNAEINVGNLPTIKGHRRQLQQLFQNLISNSIKYHKPGVPPKVSVQSRKLDANESVPVVTAKSIDKYFLIEVKDNGIGFEQADAERIFNVFTRLHGNAEYKGTGVGLSIVRKVVENHGGYIWAEGVPEKGSTFKVLLPAQNSM